MKFDIIIGNPPFNNPVTQADLDSPRCAGRKLWDRFVKLSFLHLKKNGYLAYLTPGQWRRPEIDLYKLISEKQVISLKMFDTDDGVKLFNVQQKFDWYVLKNVPCHTETTVIDTKGVTYKLKLNEIPFIPNYSLNEIFNLIDIKNDKTIIDRKTYHDQKEDKVACIRRLYHTETTDKAVFDVSLYDTRKDIEIDTYYTRKDKAIMDINSYNTQHKYVYSGIFSNKNKMMKYRTTKPKDNILLSKTKSDIYKYPVIHTINKHGLSLYYSNYKSPKMFGVPKVIIAFNPSGIPYNDYKGEYGTTQICLSYKISSREEGDDIIKALTSKKWLDLQGATIWNSFALDHRFFKYLKPDFYKDFL